MDKLEAQEERKAMKKCYFCQGEVIKKRIRHVHYWGDDIVIFENVPAEVCTQCGETFFSPEVLKMIDAATLKQTPPDKSIDVPVFSLP